MISTFGGVAPKIDPTAWVHPSATIIGDVEVGAGSSIWPGAVLRGDFGAIRVGRRTSIQDNAVLHAGTAAPTVVGDECVVAHLAFIETAVVEDLCLVGVGAVVLPGARLRRGAVAAAGAVLVNSLEVGSGERAIGVPARAVPSTHPDAAYLNRSADSYMELAARYEREGIGAFGGPAGLS